MMILVVGGTGLLGGSVARKLVGAGRSVSAVVRDHSSEKARALESAGAEVVSGDLKDRAGLERVIRGADAVVCTASATLSRREGDSIDTVDLAGVRSLIEVAEAAAVRRFVFISISPNMGDDFPLATAKRAAEERLRASRLDHVVLQPSYFAEVWFSPVVGFDVAGGTVCVYGDGEAKVSYVAVDDVSSAAARALDAPGVGRRTIPIGGPQAVSQLEAIALAERASGRRLRVNRMALDEIKAQRATAADPLQASFLGILEHLALGDEIPNAWGKVLGVRPVHMAEWFERAFGNVSRNG